MDIDTAYLEKKKALLHHIMAAFGGFMGVYAIMNRCDFMGNAQTSNLIYLVTALIGCNFKEVLYRILGWMLYVSGGTLYIVFLRKTKLNIQLISILIDILSVVCLAMIPADCHPVLALYPIFFAMAFQWNAFPGAYGFVSSTIFSTNNSRQVSLAFGEYLCDHDKVHFKKINFFLGSLLGFHIGVAFGCLCTHLFSIQAVWFNLIVLIPAFYMLHVGLKKFPAKKHDFYGKDQVGY